MAYKPYRYKGTVIRYNVTEQGKKHLVLGDVSKVLGLTRPKYIVNNLTHGNYYKSRIEFPGICPQTMWILTEEGLKELIDTKYDANKIRGFRSWLRERNLLPDEQLITTTEGIDVDATVEFIPSMVKESSNESLFQKFSEWLKTCPIELKRAL